MSTRYEIGCAICNSPHSVKLYWQGSWHLWKAPTKEQIEQRKQQKRTRRKTSF